MVLVRCGDRNIMAAGDPQLTGAHTDRSVLSRLMAAARCFCPPIRPAALMREQMLYLDEDDAAVTSDPASPCVSRDRRQRKKPPPPPFSVFTLPISRFPIHSPPVCPMPFFAPDRSFSRFTDKSVAEQRAERSVQSRFVHCRSCPMLFSAPDGSVYRFTDKSAAGRKAERPAKSRFVRCRSVSCRFLHQTGLSTVSQTDQQSDERRRGRYSLDSCAAGLASCCFLCAGQVCLPLHR